MKNIKFGVFGEDPPHTIFISNYLEQMNSESIKFSPHSDFQKDVKSPRSFKKVISELEIFAKTAFAKYYIDLLIIVFDNDKRLDSSREYQSEIRKKMDRLIEKDDGKRLFNLRNCGMYRTLALAYQRFIKL